MGQLKHKGLAINMVAPAGATIIKGELYNVNNWNVIAMSSVLPTDPELGWAGEVSHSIWYIQAPSGIVANRGDILTWAGTPNFGAGSNFWQGMYDLLNAGHAGNAGPACKVEEAVDGNWIIGVRVVNDSGSNV